ncbi:MAG TPA: 50S ribosomal protein L3 [Candidatus Paceibacterota bacterium]
MKALLGKKIGMTQIFVDEKVVPVTLVQAGPVKVTALKSREKDGYQAVQVGYEEKAKLKTQKSKRTKPFSFLKEFRGVSAQMDNDIDVSVFQEGDTIQVSGISKGKGFQGGVKRHGFHGRNATHGVKHEERGLGSVGSAFPQKVKPGRRMPGRMGADRVTVKNLKIAKIDKENNILAIKGAVPGHRGTLLEIRG